ncbi:MAG: AAA family ATPase, partial [Pseudomonadota bacterium]
MMWYIQPEIETTIMQNVINELSLYQYRNFKAFDLSITSPVVLIIGDNGTGKTNILESISMLSPGRGLRGAKLQELAHEFSAIDWQIRVKTESNLGPAQISTSYSSEANKRLVEFNGSKIPNSELAKLLKIIWLTPQMDGIFLGSGSDRRRFLDRIVYCFYPD